MSNDQGHSAGVLDGYTVIEAKGERFLVPDFAVAAVRVKLEADAKRKELGAEGLATQVCFN